MRKIKRIITLLAVMFTLAGTAITTTATTPPCDRADWYFSQRTGTLYVYRYIEDVPSYEIPWREWKGQIRNAVYTYGVTYVGHCALYDCHNLRSVYLPTTVMTIGYEAFRDCYNLRMINIPSGVKKVGFGAFENCKSLSAVSIPSTVTYIGDYSFRKTERLYSITIPASVTYIGSYAFEGSGLKTIYFKGTTAEWNAIETGYHNEWLEGVKVVCLGDYRFYNPYNAWNWKGAR